MQGNGSEAKRDAHARVLAWAHAVDWQVSRLWTARADVLDSTEGVRASGFYGHEDAWPFHRMRADAHFTLTAARQLMRALRAFDGNDRLPKTLAEEQVRLVRDALEHWDEPTGRAAKRMAELGADPSSHRWSHAGPGLLGDLVRDDDLQRWASDVYAELVTWDPW